MHSRQPAPMRQSGQAQVPDLGWLAAGAIAGLLFAAYGLLDRNVDAGQLPPGAVARVNERVITADVLERAVARLPSPPPADQAATARLWVLQRLIEDELLVQRGIELGIAESDLTVRDAIVQSLIASVTAEADAADPSEEDLRAFLQEHAERYTYATAIALDAWIGDDEAAARAFLERLGAGPVRDDDPAMSRVEGLPDVAVPVERLRMFVGPAIAAAATEMSEGSSAIFARQGRWYVVRVRAHESAAVADLDAVRSQVLVDYRRSLADQRLREYVDSLSREADVVVGEP